MKIQGKYETNNGELTISKNGDQYNGIYAQKGVISGKLSENKLEGQWSNNGLEGLFLFEFSEDGAFSGKYKKGLDPGNMRGKWTGKLVSAVEALEELKAEELVTELEEKSEAPKPKDPQAEKEKKKNPDPGYLSQLFQKEDYAFLCECVDTSNVYSPKIVEKILDASLKSGNEEIEKYCYDQWKLKGDNPLKMKEYDKWSNVRKMIKDNLIDEKYKSNVKIETQVNKQHFGEKKYNNGDSYKGVIVNEARQGKGTYYYANGDYRSGIWENDDFISGMGKITNKHGWVYKGEYLNYKRHGMGKLYNPEGELIVDGKFIKGEFEGDLKKNLETLKSAILEFAKANGFYNSLTPSFLKLFKTDDDNPGGLYEKGVDLYHNKKYEDSIKTFLKLVLKSNTDYISSENTDLTSSVDFILSNAQKLAPDEIYIKLDYKLEFNDYHKSYFSLIDIVYNLFKEINNRSINYYKVWRIYREYKYFMKTERGPISYRGPEEEGGVFNTLYGSDLEKIENYLNEMNKIEIKHEWFINELERLNKVLIKSKNTLKQRKGEHDENERKRNAENDRRREADRKQREEQKKREIEARKNSCRFEITYAVKLKEDANFGNSLMAKIEAQQQGKGFLEALSTADGKGGYRERSIRITHDTNSLSNGAAKDYVARNDRDVQKGVAGSSTIKIIRIDQL